MRFGLLGKDIAYSLSPLIHNYHFEKLGIKASYDLLDYKVIDKNILSKYKGFNVTIPYKEEIIKYCDVLSEEAKIIGAINCVKIVDDNFFGFNTDEYGFYMLLKINNLLSGNKNVLIIGAGGSGKAVFYALVKYTNHKIYITNRTIEKAKLLTNNYLTLTEATFMLNSFDIVINCTNVNTSPIKVKDIKEGAYFIDLNYYNSLFLETAQSLNAKIINGKLMLIYQAEKSFEIWFNQKANAKLMFDALERKI